MGVDPWFASGTRGHVASSSSAVAPPGALVLLAYQERSTRVSDRLFAHLAPHFERLAVASRELPRSGKEIEIYEYVRRPD